MSIVKLLNTNFVNITFYVFRSDLTRCFKEYSNKKQIDTEIQVTLKQAPVGKLTEEKCCSDYRNKLERQ